MRMRTTEALMTLLLVGGAGAVAAQDQPTPACPLHAQHQTAGEHGPAEHFAGVDRRGDKVMGFSHQRTAHHFLIEPEGGTIRVEVTDPADTESRQQIRSHLAEVARQLAAGDFSMPKAIHDRVLPGVPEMIRRKDAITYRYEEVENGGRVLLRTADPEAVAAIHAFLQAQIADHRTGD